MASNSQKSSADHSQIGGRSGSSTSTPCLPSQSSPPVEQRPTTRGPSSSSAVSILNNTHSPEDLESSQPKFSCPVANVSDCDTIGEPMVSAPRQTSISGGPSAPHNNGVAAPQGHGGRININRPDGVAKPAITQFTTSDSFDSLSSLPYSEGIDATVIGHLLQTLARLRPGLIETLDPFAVAMLMGNDTRAECIAQANNGDYDDVRVAIASLSNRDDLVDSMILVPVHHFSHWMLFVFQPQRILPLQTSDNPKTRWKVGIYDSFARAHPSYDSDMEARVKLVYETYFKLCPNDEHNPLELDWRFGPQQPPMTGLCGIAVCINAIRLVVGRDEAARRLDTYPVFWAAATLAVATLCRTAVENERPNRNALIANRDAALDSLGTMLYQCSLGPLNCQPNMVNAAWNTRVDACKSVSDLLHKLMSVALHLQQPESRPDLERTFVESSPMDIKPGLSPQRTTDIYRSNQRRRFHDPTIVQAFKQNIALAYHHIDTCHTKIMERAVSHFLAAPPN